MCQLVDEAVAHILIKAAQATRLLGAQAVLVGLRPELAQTLVGLDLDLSELVTQANLRDGVSYAFAQLHQQQRF